jgi:putative addiction module component (TIGR02574 family)
VSVESLGIDRLSVPERLALMEEVWDGAASPEAVTVTEVQREDLQRRLAASGENPKAGSPWEEVGARLRDPSRRMNLSGDRPMSPTLQALGIDRLSVAERLDLIGEIWDSIAAEVEQAPLTEAQRQEVDRRLAAHRANPQAAIPWEQVKAEALARFRR